MCSNNSVRLARYADISVGLASRVPEKNKITSDLSIVFTQFEVYFIYFVSYYRLYVSDCV